MTKSSPTMLIASTVYTDCTQWDTRGGYWNASAIAADRQHINLKKNHQDAASHTDLTARYHPRDVQEEIQSLGCKPARLCAWSDPCAPISPAELKSVPVWRAGGGARACPRGWPRAAKFNSARLISTSVPCCLASCCGAVWCVVLQCSAAAATSNQQPEAAAAAEAEAAGAANGCLA